MEEKKSYEPKDESPKEEEKEKCVMKIFLDRFGNIRVEGSLVNDKVAAYGILEAARDTIEGHHVYLQHTKQKANKNGFFHSFKKG